MTEQTPANLDTSEKWQQILDTARSLARNGAQDQIGDALCEAYSLGIVAGQQRQRDEAERLRNELDSARYILAITERERDALAAGSPHRAQALVERPPDLWLGDPRPDTVRLADLEL